VVLPPEHDPAKPVLAFSVELKTPYAALYDPADDTYLVSSVNGFVTDADNNGYVSKLSPDGKISRGKGKWIEGGHGKVTLNAPTGLALFDDKLWVADIDTLRIFDRRSGAPIDEIKIPGATFLCGLRASPDGSKLYVTDQAMRMAEEGLSRTLTDAVYTVDRVKRVTVVAKSPELHRPSDVVVMGDKTWVVGSAGGELYTLDAAGAKGNVQAITEGTLGGILSVGDDLFVGSWKGKALLRGRPGAPFRIFAEALEGPTLLALDTKRSRLLVPLLRQNAMHVFELK
jgi:DNA-binding beta-propeller fold protein YncE